MQLICHLLPVHEVTHPPLTYFETKNYFSLECFPMCHSIVHQAATYQSPALSCVTFHLESCVYNRLTLMQKALTWMSCQCNQECVNRACNLIVTVKPKLSDV